MGEWTVTGDPTEIALLIASAKGNINSNDIKNQFSVIGEIPFDSQTKCMTVTVRYPDGTKAYISKGAPDVILKKCSFIDLDGRIQPLTPLIRKKIESRILSYSDNALRVLAFSTKVFSDVESSESGMTFTGLMAMVDPIRKEAKKAIKICAKANIRTVMITGDHRNTAMAIAREAGILGNKKAITGAELDNMSDSMLLESLDDYSVFARVNPSHKLRLVKAYKQKGHIVTMTGDGVNDAPAIKEANVGVSMGITGTDVTKQAADVILLDDNFATLVKAVGQGRCIYSNIRKFVRYLLSCNIGEVITMFIGILIGYPIVLLPTQLLLVNLITDGLPAIALGLEPLDEREMNKPPRKSDESFFAGGLLSRIIFRGLLIGLCTLGSFVFSMWLSDSLEVARTSALFTLVMSQLIHVFECKSEEKSILTVKHLSNPFMLVSVAFSLICLLAVIYLTPLQAVFSLSPLSPAQLISSLLFSLAVPLVSAFFTKI